MNRRTFFTKSVGWSTGIILLFSIGFLSLVIAVLTIRKVKNYPRFIILQGCVLIGWLTAELIFCRFIQRIISNGSGAARLESHPF